MALCSPAPQVREGRCMPNEQSGVSLPRISWRGQGIPAGWVHETLLINTPSLAADHSRRPTAEAPASDHGHLAPATACPNSALSSSPVGDGSTSQCPRTRDGHRDFSLISALLWRGSETRGKRVAHLGVGFFYKVREVHFFFLSLRSFLAEGSAMNLWLLLQLVTWHAKRFAEKLNKQPPRTGHKKVWWRGVMGGAGMWERIHQTGAWWGGNRLFKQTLKLMVTFLFPENSPSFMNFRISKTIKHDNFQNTGRYV